MTMKADDLLLLAGVRQAGSLSAASRALGIPKATLSRRLAALEVAANAPIFQLGSRQLQFTEFGRQLAERAARHAEDLAETIQWLEGCVSRPQGRLRIGVEEEIGTHLVAEALAGFQGLYPEVTCELVSTQRFEVFPEETLDVALMAGGVFAGNAWSQELTLGDPTLYATPAYLERHGIPKAPADLADHRLVLSPALRRLEPRIFCGKRSLPLDVKGALEAATASMTLAMIRAGVGMGFSVKMIVERDVASGLLLPLLSDWHLSPLSINVVTPRRLRSQSKVRAFVDHLVDTAAAAAGPSR